MKIRHARHVLALFGAALAVAGTSVTAGSSPPVISLVTHAVAADEATHSEYMKRNEGRFTQWGRKVDEFNQQAARKGAAAKRDAQKKLDEAWVAVKERRHDLKQASSNGWDKANDAYEKSEQNLERAWRDAPS